MATTAALLKAAHLIIAQAKKKPAKKKAVTKKRVTQEKRTTKKTPVKRAIARKKASKAKGYFPNPIEVAAAHHSATPYHVYTIKMGKGPITGKPIAKPVKCLASFSTKALAEDFAKKQHAAVGVFKD